MSNTTENVNVKIKVEAGEGNKTIRQMRQEMKSLMMQMEEASKAGDTVRFKELESSLANLRNDIKDTSIAMKSLDPGEILSGFTKLAQGAVGSFAAITGAMTLFGGESEKLQEIQKKSMALIQVMMGLEQARQILIDEGGRKELANLFKTTAAQYKKISANLTEALTIKATANASKAATTAQLLWNKAMAANPIVAIIATVAALTTGIYLLVKAQTKETEAEKASRIERETTLAVNKEVAKTSSEIITKLNALRDIVNDTTKTEKERKAALADIKEETKGVVDVTDLSTESLAKLNTEMDAYIAQTINVAKANAALKLATEEYTKVLESQADMDQFKPGFWSSLWNNIKSGGNALVAAGKDVQTTIDNQNEAVEKSTSLMDSYLDTYKKMYKDIEDQKSKAKADADAEAALKKAGEDWLKLQQEKAKTLEELTTAEIVYRTATAKFNKDELGELKGKQDLIDDAAKKEIKTYQDLLDRKVITLEQFTKRELLINTKATQDKADLQAEADAKELEKKKKHDEEVLEITMLGYENIVKYSKDLEAKKNAEIAILNEQFLADKKKLDEDLILTEEEKAAKLKLLQEALNEELLKIDADYLTEKTKITEQQLETETRLLELHTETLNKASVKYARAQIAMLKLEAEEKKAEWKEMYENGVITYEQYNQALEDIDKIYAKKSLQVWSNMISAKAQLFESNFLGPAKDALNGFAEAEQAQIEAKNQQYQTSYDNAAALLNQQMLDTEKAYGTDSDKYKALQDSKKKLDEDKQKHDTEIDKKKKAAAKKYAEFQFIVTAAKIVSDTASAIIKAFADLGPIAGPIAAALIGAAGAAQLVAANSEKQKIQSMGRGGVVNGPAHAQGGVDVNMEGGEGVVNKNSMRIPAFRNMVSAINVAGGGIPFKGANPQTSLTANVDDSSISAIVSQVVQQVAAIPVIVSESDISKTQRRISVLESRTKIG